MANGDRRFSVGVKLGDSGIRFTLSGSTEDVRAWIEDVCQRAGVDPAKLAESMRAGLEAHRALEKARKAGT